MMTFLKNHPFAVETHFKTSLVLTYAAPIEHVKGLIPECLGLDTFEDKWGFIAVAMVNTSRLRPKGFPAFMGSDFVLTGYRVFVRYTTSYGKRLRGLYILKSETNSKRMTALGNVFTHYNYTRQPIEFIENDEEIHVSSGNGDLDVIVGLHEESSLPPNSPFNNWKEARRYAGPLPFTFTYNATNREVLIIEGVRENWTPRPVNVISDNVRFIDRLGLDGIVLANAFILQDIPYYWKKGRIDKWNA